MTSMHDDATELSADDVETIIERLSLALGLEQAPIPEALRGSAPATRLVALRRCTTAHLAALLERDRARLVQALYQVDVDEARVDAIVARRRLDEVPDALAELVIARAVAAQRLALRFRVHDSDDEFR